jgi:hypothetical protein
MVHATLLISALTLASVPSSTLHDPAEAPDFQAPPEPTITDVAAGELTETGRRVRWASVTYDLLTGHQAETFAEVDDRGHGWWWIYVEGEAVVHVTTDEHGNTTTWTADNINLPPEALVQLMSAQVAADVFAGLIPEAKGFPCSEFGKGVLKAAKYVWVATATTLQLACCVGGVGVGCLVCAVGGALAGEAGSDALEDYCA